MTRKEEIANAADKAFPTKAFYIPTFEILGFTFGARWADEHPKSPWISVKEDLPCNHEELMRTRDVCEGTETIEVFATSKGGLIWNDYMIYMNGKWRWNGNYFEPDYWMIAPKLPKE